MVFIYNKSRAMITCCNDGTRPVIFKKVLAFIQSLDIKAIATEVMYKLFAMLEMKYDFKLSKNGEMEETR